MTCKIFLFVAFSCAKRSFASRREARRSARMRCAFSFLNLFKSRLLSKSSADCATSKNKGKHILKFENFQLNLLTRQMIHPVILSILAFWRSQAFSICNYSYICSFYNLEVCFSIKLISSGKEPRLLVLFKENTLVDFTKLLHC